MATVVTVPGASNTFITESYSLTNNLAIAQQIAAALALAKSGGTLFVQNYDQNPGTVPTGDVGELAVTTPGGANIAVGTGYSYVAIDQTVTGPVSVSGAASIFAGDQTLNLSLSGNILAAVGNGNDLIGLKAGGTYTVGLGDGNDTVYARTARAPSMAAPARICSSATAPAAATPSSPPAGPIRWSAAPAR
jgi:hypothetical protein